MVLWGGSKMNLLSVKSFYRSAFDSKSPKEDGSPVNFLAGIFGVADGVSAAYSPSNPPIMYYESLTGGQMIIHEICLYLNLILSPISIKDFLLKANNNILRRHRVMGKDPTKGDDVGGASFAFCQPNSEGITFILGGDCFALVDTKDDSLFLTAFDKAAFKIEERDQDNYTECLKKTNGNKGDAWDLYWPQYKAKRISCANKNIGFGGYATLNGDPELGKCWQVKTIKWDDHPRSIILGTDGLLPPSEVQPDKMESLATLLSTMHWLGGIPKILEWRDSTEMENKCLTHIEGWPEAAAVELKFG